MPKAPKSKDAQTAGAIFASAGGAFVAAGPQITDEHGLPRRRFRKDLIRVGDWYAGDTKHAVTPERLQGWASKFSAMKAKGVDVPAPEEHTNKPSDRRGTVLGMWVEGDTLIGEIELVGEDAIAMAAKGTKVSIYAPPSVQAGDGTKWTDAIEHVALTDYPVVNGQSNFIPIAASKGGTIDVPVLRMAQESSHMDWKTVAAKIAFDVSGLDDTTGPAKVEEALAVLTNAHKTATAQVGTLTASLKTASDQVVQLSKGKLPEVDPDIVQARGEVVETKLSTLVTAGKITPNVAKELTALFTTGAAAGLCLSQKAASAAGFAGPIADAVVRILDGNQPKDLKTATGPQGTALSRTTPGGSSSDPDPAVLSRMAKAQGLKIATN